MKLRIESSMDTTERLQVGIAIYTYKIQKLEEIRQAAQQYNGKVFNKRFVDLMEGIPDVVASINRRNSDYLQLTVWSKALDYDYQNLIICWCCEDNFISNKRFDFSAFSKFMDSIQKGYSESIAKLQNDILTGTQRLEKWNELAREINRLKESFSEEFVMYHKYDFDRVSNPRN